MQKASVPFSPVADVPHVITTGPEGFDCVFQVKSLLQLKPSWKVQVGSLMVYCQDDMQESSPSYWQRPWLQHTWAIDPEGRIHDPSLWNLEHWAEKSEITLPCEIDDMQATVVPFGPETEKEVNARVQAPFNEAPEQVLAYFPGAIFGMPYDLNRPPEKWLKTWAGLAMVSANEGGLTLRQFDLALDVVKSRMASNSKSAKRKKGFANL